MSERNKSERQALSRCPPHGIKISFAVSSLLTRLIGLLIGDRRCACVNNGKRVVLRGSAS